LKGWKLLEEESSNIIWSNNVRFHPEIPMTKLPNCIDYETDEELIRLDPDFILIETEEDLEDIDSGYESLEHDDTVNYTSQSCLVTYLNEECNLTESDCIKVIQKLMTETWYKTTDEYEVNDLAYALLVVTDGADISYESAINGPEKQQWQGY
jgi:hypothetical protein